MIAAADIEEARRLAEDVRSNWDRYQNETERERRMATLLLALADELVRLRPELGGEAR